MYAYKKDIKGKKIKKWLIKKIKKVKRQKKIKKDKKGIDRWKI